MASALMAETFCLAPQLASRILLLTAESWCFRASHAARCAPCTEGTKRGFNGVLLLVQLLID